MSSTIRPHDLQRDGLATDRVARAGLDHDRGDPARQRVAEALVGRVDRVERAHPGAVRDRSSRWCPGRPSPRPPRGRPCARAPRRTRAAPSGRWRRSTRASFGTRTFVPTAATFPSRSSTVPPSIGAPSTGTTYPPVIATTSATSSLVPRAAQGTRRLVRDLSTQPQCSTCCARSSAGPFGRVARTCVRRVSGRSGPSAQDGRSRLVLAEPVVLDGPVVGAGRLPAPVAADGSGERHPSPTTATGPATAAVPGRRAGHR